MRRERERAEIIDTDGNAGPFRQKHRNDRPADVTREVFHA